MSKKQSATRKALYLERKLSERERDSYRKAARLSKQYARTLAATK